MLIMAVILLGAITHFAQMWPVAATRHTFHGLSVGHAGWRLGVVVNEVSPRRAQLVLGWVTVFGWV